MTRSNLVSGEKLLLVGYPGVEHVGARLAEAAKILDIFTVFLDSGQAFEGPLWLTRFNWRFRGHRPTRLREFSQKVFHACRELKPKWLLSTGLAPIEKATLEEIGKLGVQRLNYLTDDPWNPAHRAGWFMKALPFYDHVFSVRRSNLEDLKRIGCQRVSYLPFGYAPELHYPEPPATTGERVQFDADVVFVGGADRDRIPYISALIKEGFKIGLYGGYWDRFPETRAYTRGLADPRTLRMAIGGAKVALCLVRRANRDGNSMRTFETPAVGACMLTEDTEEHREIFGEEGRAVVYFQSISEMIEKLRRLLENERERKRLAHAAYTLIVNGHNTYLDRLTTMLDLARI